MEKQILDALNAGHPIMLGEYLGCEHRAGKFTDPKKGTTYSDNITHAILVAGGKAVNVLQRVKMGIEGQTAQVNPDLKRGVRCLVTLSSVTWADFEQKFSASNVQPLTGK